MKKTFVVMIAVAFILVGTVTVLGYLITNKNNEYYKFEKDLEVAAKGYFGEHQSLLPVTALSINSDTLIKEGRLEEMFVGDETCQGYVIVTKQNVAYKYKAYLSCPDYISKNYDSQKFLNSDL